MVESTINPSELMTVSEAASALSVSRGSIYDAIERGEIRAVMVLGRKAVLRKDVESYVPRGYEGKRENPRAPGEPGPSRWKNKRSTHED